MTDMQMLFTTIEALTPSERDQLRRFLDNLDTAPPRINRPPRILGLNAGALRIADDFNDPLPDSFWLGEE